MAALSNPFGLVLDVIDNQAVDRQRPKPHYMLGHDGLQLYSGVACLGGAKP